MKTLIRLFIGTAILLAAANVYFRSRSVSTIAEARTQTKTEPPSTPAPTAKIDPPAALAPAPAPVFAWETVETSDYKGYIGNLRSLAFPEELIREIIIADVNKMYAAREEPLKPKPVPYDVPLNQRRRDPTLEELKQLIQLRDIQIEKQDLLHDLLGVRVPRELIRASGARNYEATDFAISQLPPEKREEALRIQEKLFLEHDLNKVRLDSDEERAAYVGINEERDAELKKILTPEEFERFIMNSTPAGSEMQRRVIGMEPTDEEMLAMWELTREQWKEQGGVFGRWRANRVPPEQIRAADDKLEAGLRSVLGPERFLDYQMAVNETGQQLRNFAARYDLPRETLAQAFAAQTEIDRLQKGRQSVQARYGLPESAVGAPPLAGEQQRLQQILGPDLYRAWNEGRAQKYDLQP
jgi:hypothetical protein